MLDVKRLLSKRNMWLWKRTSPSLRHRLSGNDVRVFSMDDGRISAKFSVQQIAAQATWFVVSVVDERVPEEAIDGRGPNERDVICVEYVEVKPDDTLPWVNVQKMDDRHFECLMRFVRRVESPMDLIGAYDAYASLVGL